MQQSDRVLFVDVETTGLSTTDRVVSLGFVDLHTDGLEGGRTDLRSGHFVFNPGCDSHPDAAAVHGYDDATLRLEEPFEARAAELRPYFERAALVVAHNVDFDVRFIQDEFARAGLPLAQRKYFCTMKAYRAKFIGRAGLEMVLAEMGIARPSKRHGSLDDAWMAMLVYHRLLGLPAPATELPPRGLPSNWHTIAAPASFAPAAESRPAVAAVCPADANREADWLKLIAGSRPLATLLMWVARADGLSPREIDVLCQMVRAQAERLAIAVDATVERDVVATLRAIDPSEDMIDSAAWVVIRDEGLRTGLGAWINRVAYADGKPTEATRRAIERVTEAFARTRPKRLAAE